MHYEGNIIRPPSEANSILLQVTVGCSRNKCTFCGAYKKKNFRIKSENIIMRDILYAKKHMKDQKRLFLCDGDALIIPQKRIIKIIKNIKKNLPKVNRIGTYANIKGLQTKSLDDLLDLKHHGLKIIYLGIETGDNKTLKDIRKGTTKNKIIKLCHKIKMAGIKLSVTILLGIAGKKRSLIHAKQTGDILSIIDPEYVGVLSLMMIPNTELYKKFKSKKFELLTSYEMLLELKKMFNNTNLSNGLFYSNHASNYLTIKANLPKDKEKVLNTINQAIEGKIKLKSEKKRFL